MQLFRTGSSKPLAKLGAKRAFLEWVGKDGARFGTARSFTLTLPKTLKSRAARLEVWFEKTDFDDAPTRSLPFRRIVYLR